MISFKWKLKNELDTNTIYLIIYHMALKQEYFTIIDYFTIYHLFRDIEGSFNGKLTKPLWALKRINFKICLQFSINGVQISHIARHKQGNP
jgi:hypothetical protein